MIKIYPDLNSLTFKKKFVFKKKKNDNNNKTNKEKIKVKAKFVIKGKNIFK